MNGTAAISILFILVVSRSLKCTANKTDLVIATLEIKQKYKGPTIGIDLAIEVAKNSSDLKAFLEKYEITIDTYYTRVSFVLGKGIYMISLRNCHALAVMSGTLKEVEMVTADAKGGY